ASGALGDPRGSTETEPAGTDPIPDRSRTRPRRGRPSAPRAEESSDRLRSQKPASTPKRGLSAQTYCRSAAGATEAPTHESISSLRGTLAAHSGHSDGVQISFSSAARLSRARPCVSASIEAPCPRTARAPMATGIAPNATSSSSVPRTADPALITSLTIATLLPLTRARNPRGREYLNGKSSERALLGPRSVYVKGSASDSATMIATKAPSTRGPQTTTI